MFNQNNEEKKLDWMYKGPNSLVEREEYLLGRAVDKTLEQLNEEEKQKQQGIVVSKNRVEHECIPPSIRDFNKVVQAEQVDLSAKLQEDPLVAIKKREEETRRQFLQNPVQLKKLQKALKAQQAKKNKKKKKKKKSKDSDDSGSDLDKRLTEKLLGKKNKKVSKEERNLDTILIHKYEEFKDKLTESDLQDILDGKITDSEDSSEDENSKLKSRKKRHTSSSESDEGRKRYQNSNNRSTRETYKRRERTRYDSSYEENSKSRKNSVQDREYRRNQAHDDGRYRNQSKSPNYKSRTRNNDDNKYKQSNSTSSSESESDKRTKSHHLKTYDSDDSDSSKNKKMSYGLVNSDGVKIPLSKKRDVEKEDNKYKPIKAPEPPPPTQKHRSKRLTEEEKEKLRREMMENAVWRDKERTKNVKRYREKEEKEKKEQNFDPEFIHKQLLKSAHTSSVESRIKANVNNIQRSRGDMDKHFSRRE